MLLHIAFRIKWGRTRKAVTACHEARTKYMWLTVVFLYFFALIAEEGFLISSCYSLELCIQMFISFLYTSLLFTAVCKASPDSHFAFLHSFPWGWPWSLSPVQCHELLSIVHQALYLSDLVHSIYFSLPLYNHKGFDLGHTYLNGLVVFLTFFNFSLNLAIRSSWSEP